MQLSRSGLLWGLVGVLAFSFTLPFTRVAVNGLSPLFIGLLGLAVLFGALVAGWLGESGRRLRRES